MLFCAPADRSTTCGRPPGHLPNRLLIPGRRQCLPPLGSLSEGGLRRCGKRPLEVPVTCSKALASAPSVRRGEHAIGRRRRRWRCRRLTQGPGLRPSRVCGCVDGGGERACSNAGGACDEGEQNCFGEELEADMALSGAQGSAQPDLGSSFQDRDDHDICRFTAPTSRATAPSPRKRSSKAPWASAWATSAVEGWETSTSLAFWGLAVPDARRGRHNNWC